MHWNSNSSLFSLGTGSLKLEHCVFVQVDQSHCSSYSGSVYYWMLGFIIYLQKYPLIQPIFLHKNTKSCITLLAFSDSVSPSSIVYPRWTTFTLVPYLGKTRQRARIWIKYYDVIFSTVLSFFKRVRKKDSTVVCTFYVTNDVIYMRWRCITVLSSTKGTGGARGTKMKKCRKTQ